MAAADWLMRVAGAIGGRVGFEAFDVSRLDARDPYLALEGGVRILGEALYDAPGTPEGGVSGRLGTRTGGIRVVERPPDAAYSPGFVALRQRPGPAGLVVVTTGGAPGLALLDAPAFRAPFGPPTLQVTSFEHARLTAAMARGAMAKLVVATRRTATNARNVVVRVAGRVPGLAPLVVATPRSAWWHATGERGGGLVCWLEALRALAEAPPTREVLFLATSGDELGHLGLSDFLARHRGIVAGATWVQLGANIGAAGGTVALAATTPPLRHLAAAAVARAGHPAVPLGTALPDSDGTIRAIQRAGAACVALGGTNRLFHLPQDRWPHAVDLDRVVRLAAAVAEIVARLGRQAT